MAYRFKKRTRITSESTSLPLQVVNFRAKTGRSATCSLTTFDAQLSLIKRAEVGRARSLTCPNLSRTSTRFIPMLWH